MPPLWLRSSLVVLLAVLGLAAPARASTAVAGSGVLTVTAPAGEVNDLLVTSGGAPGVYLVSERAPLLTLGRGGQCFDHGGGVARCTGISSITVDAGDGGDAVTIDTTVTLTTTITDGPGNDTVHGGNGADTFNASAGDDTLDGRGGDDTFGDGGGQGADTIIGGDGSDHANYSTRSAGITVSADGVPGDGAAGENDNVSTTVERLTGGNGADVLTGTDTANTLKGAGGDDVLDGRLGDDTLEGGTGRDTADYGARSVRVVVSADGATGDGATGNGERDNVAGDIESLRGGSGNDELSGNGSAGTIDGGAGNDTLRGNGGDDLLLGDAGSDTIAGGDGHDLVRAGDGRDTIDGGANDDTIDGGAGDDAIAGAGGTDTVDYSTRTSDLAIDLAAGQTIEGDTLSGIDGVLGGAGNDRLKGNDSDGRFDGGPGDDTIDGRGGADRIAGGSGFDHADYAARRTNVAVSLNDSADDGQSGERDDVRRDVERVTTGSGSDRFSGHDGAEVYTGGAGDDQASGAGGDDVLDGGDGRDALWPGKGNDVARGGSGDDRLGGDDGNDTLDGGTGDDTLDGNGGADVLAGGDDDDRLSGHDGADILQGGADADALYGGNDADVLEGGGANDQLYGGAHDDRLTGDWGNDRLYGDDGQDAVDGGDGADTADGGRGGDQVTGAAGDDRLSGGEDPDVVDGGDGNDTVSGNAGDDTLEGATGNDTLYGGTGQDVSGGSDGDDKVYGEDGNDRADGGLGNDTVEGGKGDDAVTGADGDDKASGGDGGDTVDGGAGNDRVGGGSQPDVLAGGPGTDTVYGDDGDDRLDGGDGADEVGGGNGDDVVVASPGADEMAGDSGEDTVDFSGRTAPLRITNDGKADDGEKGEQDNVAGSIDRVIGGAGGDLIRLKSDWPHKIYGEGGNDVLDGGPKADTLVGGPGNDQLIGREAVDTFDGGSGADKLSGADGTTEILRCGAGKDSASRDKSDRAIGCEKLRIGSAAKPSAPAPQDTAPVALAPGRRTGVKRVFSRGRFVSIPGSPGEKIDRRLLKDIAWLKSKYRVAITDGYAMTGHSPGGEHPRGLAVDLIPGPGGSWSDVDRLARFAEPRQGRPRAPFRWVGYNGDSGHGRGHHLHLSWRAARTKRGRPAKWVEVFSFKRGAPTVRVRDLTPLARTHNGRIGGAPSVKTGIRALTRCKGPGQLVGTWKAAGRAFRINWKILAAITEIESGHGCNMGPSSAGALGWTQFMPATWKRWGMDADGDGKASPFNSADAVFSSARYLRATGAPRNYRKALFAYNHATWYVNDVLRRARKY